MNTKLIKSVIAMLILAIGTSLLSSCGPNKEAQAEQAETVKQVDAVETPTVVLTPVTKGKLSSTIAVPGELIPYQEVDLFAKVNSYVKNLLVDIGSQVHQGQLLATLEAPEINSQLAAAKSRIEQQQAIYYASKATYDRLLSTSKTPGTEYKVIVANLNYLEIRAPFDGVITARNVNLGAYVGPGRGPDPLFVIQDQKRLRLVVSIPESYTGGLSNKDEVTFTVKALPNQKFTAQVKRLAGALDVKLRSERLEMDVYNKDKKLLPHMFAEVDVPLPSRDSTFILPKSAVVTSTEKVFVIKVVDHKAVWVDVKKGLQSGDMTEVYGDLKTGEQVVSKASDEIRDGSGVKDKL